jgi:hypothetical protein
MRACARAAGQFAALEPHQQQRDGGRGDALDAAGLADGLGLVLVEAALHFLGEAAHGGVVEVGGQAGVLGAGLAGDFVLLAVDVALVLGGDLELLDHLRVGLGASGAPGRVISAA